MLVWFGLVIFTALVAGAPTNGTSRVNAVNRVRVEPQPGFVARGDARGHGPWKGKWA